MRAVKLNAGAYNALGLARQADCAHHQVGPAQRAKHAHNVVRECGQPAGAGGQPRRKQAHQHGRRDGGLAVGAAAPRAAQPRQCAVGARE
jgi:hypothetical protein